MKKIGIMITAALSVISAYCSPVREALAARSAMTIDSEEGMVEVEWIMSDGNAYIDTGFVPNDFTPFTLRCAFGTTFTSTCFMGCAYYDGIPTDWSKIGTIVYGFASYTSDRRFAIKARIYNDHLVWNKANGGNEYYDGQMHDIVVSYDAQAASAANTKIEIDGMRLPTDTIYAGSSISYNTTSIVLFGIKYNDGTVFIIPSGSQFKVQYFKIGDLELIPVRIGQVGYMYDQVSGELFRNQGTGSFIIGPDKQ